MAEYSRPADGVRFLYKGMSTMNPPDAMPQGKFVGAQNLRAYLSDVITPRLPQGPNLLATLLPDLVIHSLRRLNDTTPLGPPSGFALIIGAGTNLYKDNSPVESGFSGNRLSFVSFRPDANPQPWMYVGDSVKQVKVNSAGLARKTGIAEPQVAATVANSPLTNPAINSPVFYRYRYRDSRTGAKSNASPPMRTGFSVGGFAPSVSLTPSTDPQVDTIDVFRFDGALLDYTYAGSSPNGIGPFIDTLDDSTVSNNPLLEFDNFEPFPSIDIPHSGTVTVNGTTITWASGDQFNIRWAPESIILIDGKPATLYARPTSPTTLEIRDGAAIANQQPIRAGTGINDPGALIPAGTVLWANPANVNSTVSYAVATIAGAVGITKALLTRGYGFTIPGGATILGIKVDFECFTTIPAGSDRRISVSMYKPAAAGIFGTETIFPVPPSVTSEPVGNSSFLWATTWTPADINDPNFGPALVGIGTSPGGDINLRNVITTVYFQGGGGGAVSYQVAAATLLDQPMPAWWGPTDNTGFFFACGDLLRPGTLYFTKGNNPDSAPDTNQIEVTSPSEPLMNGVIVGGIGMVFSTERAWQIYPNFAQAVATITGIQGKVFNLVESISERGLYARQGICTDGGGWVYFIAKDGIRKSPAGSGSQSITDDDLYNLFPHEGIPQTTYTVKATSGTIFSISPPDFKRPNDMALRFAQGYVYYDYIALNGAPVTLTYDVTHEAWCIDVYGTPVSIHADNEGEANGVTGAQVGIGTLMGCRDGSVRSFLPSGSEPGQTMLALTPAYDNGDRRAQKRFGDIFVEALCPAGKTPFTIGLYANKYATSLPGLIAPTTTPAVLDGIRHSSIVDVNNGDGVYAVDVEMTIQAPVDSVGAQFLTWQPSLVAQPATTSRRVTDWDDAQTSGAKFVQGLIVEADTFNVAKLFTVQSGDDLSLHVPAEMGSGVAFNGQTKKAFSFAVPFIAHNMRIVSPDNTQWNLFGVEWVFVPYPELCLEWHTEGTSHGFLGFQHIKEIDFAHISTADLTLTLTRDTGGPVSVTVPNSGGVLVKTLVQIPPPFKFKIVSYSITSTQKFRLWVADLEVSVKQWGDPGPYKSLKPFGGPSTIKALV